MEEQINLDIMANIYKALESLHAPFELLALVGSYGDTLDNNEILEMLIEFNETGEFGETIISVFDTPEDRRNRL